MIYNSSKLKNVWMLEENNKDFLIDVERDGNYFVDNCLCIVNPCEKYEGTTVNKVENDEVMVSYKASLEGETHLQIFSFVHDFLCENWKFHLLETFDGLCNYLQRVDMKYLELEAFLGSHNMVVKCMLKINFEIAYVVYQCLGLFFLMVIVKVCEVVVWMSENDQSDQHINVIWINVGNDFLWIKFDEDENFNVHYDFCYEWGVYYPM